MATSLPHFSPSIRSTAFRCHQRQLTSAASLRVFPKGLGFNVRSLNLGSGFRNRRFVISSFEASQDEPKQTTETEINVDDGRSEVHSGEKESQEEWEKMLETFKEKAIKMQGISQEAYEVYSKKANEVLKETSEKLKIEAEKAKEKLGVLAKEISEDGKDYLSVAAEKSPEEVKDIVETFATSTDEYKEVSTLRDFYVGIPYGAILSLGGFLAFMLTGSTSAIRFGVILGGALLALSVSSLRSWKRGEPSDGALKGQTAIAGILFLKELSERPSITSLSTLISGAVLMFYVYRIMVDGNKNKGQSMEPGSES